MKVLKNLFGKKDKIHIDEIAMKQGDKAVLLSGTVIIEDGKNENGSYIKFGNGIMICWKESFTLDFELPRTLNKIWRFPVPFIEIPMVQVTSRITNDSARGNHTIILFYPKKESIHIYAHSHGSSSAFRRDTTDVAVFAIGRWK